MADNGTPTSFTLETVKGMGYNPIMIAILGDEEVFVFETKEEAAEAESDFTPEGIWVIEDQLEDLKIQGLGKVYDLQAKAVEEQEGKAVAGDQKLDAAVAALKSKINGDTFVFSGFRSDVLKKNIENLGGKVEDRVTKRTNLLIAKDTSKETNKSRTAKSYGISVISMEDFNAVMNNALVKSLLGI